METMQILGAAAPGMTTSGRVPIDPCVMVIFGASGDLTKRLLMPALYNLFCDGLLPAQFAVVGMAMDELTTDAFRERMTRDVQAFNTRTAFDPVAWNLLCSRLYYIPGKFDDAAAFSRLYDLVVRLDDELHGRGNVLFYMATPPAVFSLVSSSLDQAGFKKLPGWKRLIVEKPFGNNLASAQELNRSILSYWDESQIYRIDHYLGKETVQNILTFRFANGMFEPIWSKEHVDHIQFTVFESVSVEGRGAFYDRFGVLRDMVQNHMFQMLAYICMEPPGSFEAEDIRNERAKVLKSLRVYTPDEAYANTVRGQYGAGTRADGTACPDYRQEPGVDPRSTTDTFAAVKLFIDNWRWEGVPIYLRSGKALWKRGTEIVVQFKKAPSVLFRGTGIQRLASNRIIFHIQPDQGIESLFQAKVPGMGIQLQPVNMRFNYGEAFRASRGTGYEVMIYNCMIGDSTLFLRTDLVETAWRVAQPILEAWATHPPTDFPNYAAGTWGPRAANDLMERDGRRWFEVITRETLERVPLFRGGDPLFLHQVSMALRPRVVSPGQIIVKKGEPGLEMFLICRGEVEVVDSRGQVQATLREGDCFGEVSLLLSEPRTATVRAKTLCDLFVLEKVYFKRILQDHPQFAQAVKEIARERYQKAVAMEHLLSPG